MSGFRLLQNKGSTFTELINKMEITNLKQMTKEEVFNLIRQRLSFGDELQQQLRHVDNLGIYNYTSYLFLDFYMGVPTVYLKYFSEDENLEYTLDGYTTTEIIFTIFELTIFSGKPTRRRK